MSLHVDADGKVQEGSDGEGFSATAQSGHRLSDSASASATHFRLPHFELPRIEVPTGVYVAVGMVGVVVVGAPLVALYLLGRTARTAVQAASVMAPAVAQAGPAILPLVPEAAPVVAAASLLTALRSGAPSQAAPPPASLADGVASLVRSLGSAGVSSSAGPSSEAPTQVFLRARGTLPVPNVDVPAPVSGSTTLLSPRR